MITLQGRRLRRDVMWNLVPIALLAVVGLGLSFAISSWWGPAAWRLGSLGLWAWKLRTMNGPHFTWPLMMFASALPEPFMGKLGRIHIGRPLAIKTRKELLATIKPSQWKYLRPDNGDMPEAVTLASASLGSRL